METERHLLFGALCVKCGLISFDQLAAAVSDWNVQKSESSLTLADLIESGRLIQGEQRAHIERLMAERLYEFGGDVRKTLDDVLDEQSLIKLAEIARDELPASDVTQIEQVTPSNSTPSRSSSGTWNVGSTQAHFHLSEETGQGGFGQIWLARDVDLNRKVAIKTLKEKFGRNQEAVARLLREAQITGQLEHPNVIRVYELAPGSAEQRPYFSMQLIRNKRTLKAAIQEYHTARREGTDNLVEFRRLLDAFVAICQALGYAHSRGVLHRDLKPHNVMLGRYGEAIVIDWGLAKFEAEIEPSITMSQIVVTESGQVEESKTGQVLGTPGYMAPEQAAGQLDQVDVRSDIYGLGAILFEILTGQGPHDDKRGKEILKLIVEQPSPVAKQLAPQIPAALDAICSKAIAKQREDRYQKALALAEDMRNWLAGEPVSAYAEPWPDRVLRWLRKHRAAATAAAVVLIAIAVTSSIAAVAINRARGREELAKQTAVERLSEAEQAVDVSLTGVNEVLKFYPSAQPVRLKLLEQAATDYARFARVNSDDLNLQLEAARAQMRLGNVRLMLEQFERAIADFDEADKRLSAIESRLSIATFERGLAAAQRADALHRSGRSNEAKSAFEKSLELLDRGASSLPADAPLRAERAEAHLGLARVLQQLGDLDGARRQINLSLKLLDDRPEGAVSRDTRRVAAKAEHSLAQLEMAVDQLDPAAAALARALKHYAALLSVEKNFPVWLDGQALCRITLANLQRRQGRDVEALETYQKAIGDFDDLARAIPGVPHYEHLRILARTDTALLRLTLGQAPLAHDLLASSIGRVAQLAEGDEPQPDLIETAALAHAAFGAALRELGQSAESEEALLVSRELFQKLPKARLTPDVRRQAAVVVGQLARLSAESDQLAEGLTLFRQADEELRTLIADNDADAASKNALAAMSRHWADALFTADRREEAAPLYRQAAGLWRDLPDEVDLHIGQLWLLLTCAEETSRDPGLAVTIAERLRAHAPDNVRLLALLSLAKAQLGDTDSAERLAKQSQQRLAAGNSTAAFVLALVQHQRGRKEDALAAFDTATKQMTEQHPASWSARRLRELVAKELGQK
ncbi:MAG: protein kinase domain-containing protein [Planctomycetaceae bacterium]